MEKIACKLCSAASHLKFNVKGYVKHIQHFHAHQTNFKVTCGIDGCQRTYTNYGTFSNHVYAMHHSAKATCSVWVESNNADCVTQSDDCDDDISDDDEVVECSEDNSTKEVACVPEECCTQEFEMLCNFPTWVEREI